MPEIKSWALNIRHMFLISEPHPQLLVGATNKNVMWWDPGVTPCDVNHREGKIVWCLGDTKAKSSSALRYMWSQGSNIECLTCLANALNTCDLYLIHMSF